MYAHSPNGRWALRRRTLASAGIATLVLAGCAEAAENLIESGVEQAIENESGGDVDIDLDGGDGGFSIETEEGSMTIDENGEFVIEGADGEVITGESTDDGFTVTNEDGTAVFEADDDAGTFTAESEDGSFSAGPGIPDEWPASVQQPDGLTDVNGSVINTDGEFLVTVSGTTSDGAAAFFDSYTSTLEGEGFERSSYFEGDGFRQGSYDGAGFSVSVVADDDSQTIAVTILPTGG